MISSCLLLPFCSGRSPSGSWKKGFRHRGIPPGISPDTSLINPDTSPSMTPDTSPDMTRSTGHGANRRMQSPPLIPDASGGHRHFPPAICPAITETFARSTENLWKLAYIDFFEGRTHQDDDDQSR